MSAKTNFTLKPRKPVAKPVMGFIATALYIAVAVGILSLIYSILKSRSLLPSLCCIFGSLVILGVFKFCFDWFKSGEVSIRNYGEVIYTEHGILKVSGKDSVKYKVKDITSVIERPYEILIEGDVTYIDELGKSSTKSKFKILGVCDNREDLVTALKEHRDGDAS